MIRQTVIAAPTSTVCLALGASPAAAHAFGQRYDLPLPFWLYITGAGATVALSFVIVALFLGRGYGDRDARDLDALRFTGLRWLGHQWVRNAIEGASVGAFALILAACFFGKPDPFGNIAPTFVWVVWWVGFAFLSALVGNLWDLVNPWRILFRWATRRREDGVGHRPYPVWLGYWPAVFFLLAFAWMELISESAEKPPVLGALILLYTLLTWTGMACFGCEPWLRHGEVFSVVFGVLARIAPVNGRHGTLRLRFPATGLLVRHPVPISYVSLVLLLLATVTFDGILETPFWQSLVTWVSESMTLRETLLFLQGRGVNLLMLLKTIALVAMPLVFIGAYLAVSGLVGRAGSGGMSLRSLAGFFVLSLVPIAIAYHLAHYLSYLLIAGQNIIPLASDPFGAGWDLFDTRRYQLDLGIVNAKMVWYVAVSGVVTGHVVAVYVAHVMALRVFPTTRQALFSQIPMLLLMVGYTMVSLWILSQPIVAG